MHDSSALETITATPTTYNTALCDAQTTVKLRTEAPASINTNCLDPRPVSGTRRLYGTWLLSIILTLLIFATDVRIWHGTYCIRLRLLGITASEKILNACYV